MMTPAHFFGGYIALSGGKKFWALNQISRKVQLSLLTYGLVLSVAIDLDVLVSGGITGHHKLLTHYPFFWLAISGVLYGFGRYLNTQVLKSLAIVTLLASWSHMILDLVGITMGIHWFWPFSMTEFSITPIQPEFPTEQARWDYIMSSPVMWVGDSSVVVFGLAKMIHELSKGRRLK